MAKRIKQDPQMSRFDRLQLALWPDHQALITMVVLTGVVLLSVYFWNGSRHGGWVDIEAADSKSFQFQVDLNRAEWFEFNAIPGIGEVTAKRIVQHRNALGGFSGREQLLEVPGIGPKTLRKMNPFLLPLD